MQEDEAGGDAPCWPRCKGKVREFDQFGVPVQLNFNKEAAHNTFIGGVCTIIFAVLMAMIVIGELITLFFMKNFSMATSTEFLKRDND